MSYTHPYKDTDFVLQHLVGFDDLCTAGGLDEVNMELAAAVLEEAGKLGSDVLAPLNWSGDQEGVALGENGVQEAKGFKEAYQQLAEGGWLSLTAEEKHGGQNLPNVLGTAVSEIWNAANMSFALCPLLSQGAMESITHHGDDFLQETFLPRMVSGEWPGTMNLTEPDAGTDLAAVKTRAEQDGDIYRITGQKIFITWGDHQMTDNIVHLVLARLPDAPPGVKGISLFIVPKFMVNEDGSLGERNSLKCLSVEHKLGIHASPTCVMEYNEAKGYLVGEAHNGLSYMFTMMNHARQSVGLQGLAIAERAYQQAAIFARERVQGTRRDGSRIPIIQHPDVRRMLMMLKSGTEAMRAVALEASAEIDRAASAEGEQKGMHSSRVELWTPIVKAWLTELAQELTSLNVQIHGGMGFIEETGAAQHYRDARILPIYEGTTGIQALDFIGRKTLSNQGTHLAALLADMQQTLDALTASDYPHESVVTRFKQALEAGKLAHDWLLTAAPNDKALAGSAAVNFMMTYGYLAGGWMMVRSGMQAKAMLDQGEGDAEFLNAKLITVRFFCEHLLPRTLAHQEAAMAGSESIMALAEDMF
ncbi:MAG: acyl-CoA dehydrogenase C-terminal domain-containing protein [Thiolinea sp.]